MKRKRIFYSYIGKSTFIQKDLDIFKSDFDVVEFNFLSQNKSGVFLLFINQIISLLRFGFKTDLFISHFSGYHSFLPGLFGRVFRKKVVQIAGGTDCHSFPSIGYGNFQKPVLRNFTKWSYHLCDHISAKHFSLWECEYTYDDHDFPKQGIHAFMPGLKKNLSFIPNGFDSSLFKRSGNKIPKTFLTIAGNLKYPFQNKLKGIDLILKVASNFPEYSFTIIAIPNPVDGVEIPGNVIFKAPLQNAELIQEYSKSEYYLQLSIAEGFPNSLCEAMLCECIPIGSNVFSIPEIIGENGFVLQHRNTTELESLIRLACSTSNYQMAAKARKDIEQNYPLLRRKTELLQLCHALINH